MIELRRLRAFAAVAEEENVTRAAEKLGMQQPPLTRLLRGMETELGVKLLIRLPRGVRPTEAGMALLEEARVLLARAARIPETIHRVARGEQGRLAIGFTSSAALHPFVPEILRRYRQILPGVSIVLEEAGTGELVDALMKERLDAAFVRSPVANVSGLLVDPVLDEPMLAALPKGHPLADKTDKPLPLAALAGEDFIRASCRRAGFSPAVAQEAPRLPATLSLVAAGLGISIVPASMRRIGGDGVVYRALSGCPGLSAPLHLVMRQARLTPALTRFRKLVQEMRKRRNPGAPR
jgi:DNA-binding transcriptional LysR family regulator